jgi:hypothetical protein
MKKYLPFAASLVLFAVGACNSSPTETASPTKPTSTSASPDKASNTDSKPVASDAAGWQDYTSEGGKFSVLMPTKPQELSQEKKTDIGTVKINMALSESKDSAYIVGYNDFPGKFTDDEISTRLNLGAKGFMSGSMKGTITSSKETKLGEIPCLDFDGSGKIQAIDAKAKGRICIANNARLYQVVMATPSNKFSQADADRFISSFKIKT